MHIIATAGHVDHGKSTLVRALTGTDPDRLTEEKERGLTIDLGFAFTDLSSGNPTSWNWSFIGGTPNVSSIQNPTITYNTEGKYSVSLTTLVW